MKIQALVRLVTLALCTRILSGRNLGFNIVQDLGFRCLSSRPLDEEVESSQILERLWGPLTTVLYTFRNVGPNQ
jgi:hypothetical protein